MGDATEFIAIESAVEWYEPNRPERLGQGFLTKQVGDGLDGRPSIWFGIQPEGFKNPAHFHTEAQFQVLLEGSATFSRLHVEGIAVHYSDAYSFYGPFHVGPDFNMAVLRCRDAGQVHATDEEQRHLRNPKGRELYGPKTDAKIEGLTGRQVAYASDKLVPWTEAPGQADAVLHKVLMAAEGDSGPTAVMYRCPAGTKLSVEPAPFGAFHLLLAGTALVNGTAMDPYSMRYVHGDDTPEVLVAGDDGADWIVLTFDQHEYEGGPDTGWTRPEVDPT